MTQDQLLDREHIGLEEWSVTPNPETIMPQSARRDEISRKFLEDIEQSTRTIVLTHGDADGLTSGALIRILSGPGTEVQTISYAGAYTLEDALQDLISTDYHYKDLFILDFNPDSPEAADYLDELAEKQGFKVTWYDHHQWEEDVFNRYSSGGIDILIDEDECTASLIGKEFERTNFDISENIQDLIAVTKDRDLWIRDDPRSEDLSTFAELAETDEYIETVIEHGADLPDGVLERVYEKQQLDAKLEEMAIERTWSFTSGDLSIGMTYTSGGVSSNIGNEIVEETDADIAVVLHDSGGASIYSHSNRETFAKCHKVAERMGGGGHPTAAGFGFDFNAFRDLAMYWETAGKIKHAEILSAIGKEVDDES